MKVTALIMAGGRGERFLAAKPQKPAKAVFVSDR